MRFFGVLVYGQPQFREKLSNLLSALSGSYTKTRPDCLEGLRALLIQTGQVEQAVEDYEAAKGSVHLGIAPTIRGLTDLAASAFLSRWLATFPTGLEEKASGLKDFAEQVLKIRLPNDPLVTVRVAEGFEFYVLFPEQYCLAAMDWAKRHADAMEKSAVVIGVRSIGTSLSALVAVVLRARGWQVRRFTVRPFGPPFARRVELGASQNAGANLALVVDEGPGLSGSSMAATAQALEQAGFGHIAFLPGHPGDPGDAAASDVRRTWSVTPRFCHTVEDLRWNGKSLQECLAYLTEEIDPCTNGQSPSHQAPHDSILKVQDLSAGMWRGQVFSKVEDWPAVATRFERTKFLCQSRCGPPLLWKFTGLGCLWEGGRTALEIELERLRSPGSELIILPPSDAQYGFLPIPWSFGARLARIDSADESVIDCVARYALDSGGPRLSPTESQSSIGRLVEMLGCNLKETFGESKAEQAQSWAEAALATEPLASYGDGRMAPYEWVRQATGRIIKTDYLGNAMDHTLVGRQSLLWDIAGALIEWNLDRQQSASFVKVLHHGGIRWDPGALFFYQLAYASYRMGLLSFCGGQTGKAENARLETAMNGYRQQVKNLLSSQPGRAKKIPR